MRLFSTLIFAVLAACFLTGAAKKPASKEGEGPISRTAEILGWSPDAKTLIYREETETVLGLVARAVIVESTSGKLIKEHPIQDREDGPDIVSVRENNLQVLMEHEGFHLNPPTPFFIGAGKRGFLAPNGQYLLYPTLNFARLAGKKGLQSLTINFVLTDLKNSQEWNVAQMIIESVDGEHPLTTDSVSAVSLRELHWGPRDNLAAAILEEKRQDFLIQGVFTLRLTNLPDLSLLTVAAAPSPTPTMPTSVSTPAAPAASGIVPEASLRQYYQPEGGQTDDLEWLMSAVTVSADRRWQAVHNYYRACNGTPFAAQITLFDEKQSLLHEMPLGAALDPKGVSLDWGGTELKILFLGEPLRSVVVQEKDFQSFSRTPRAFAIQLASFATEEKAKQQVMSLCEIGLPAYSLTFSDDRSGAPRFRVRLGRFSTEEKARQFAKETLKGQFPKYLVTRF